ncbi:MAG: hypothetical protein WBM62_15795, partial [Crocosphaera sp.]
ETLLELLIVLIERFEEQNYPIPQGTPNSMLNPHFSQNLRSPNPEALQYEGLNRAIAKERKRQCVLIPRQ